MQEKVFVSYRREGGDITAKLICEALKNRGYTVFYDFDSISGGFFDERILDAIHGCNDFVLVLPPKALDRCINEKDWVRLEIACALNCQKNIVPVLLPGFTFPSDLPADIKDVSRVNGVSFYMAYFDGVIDTIVDRLVSKPEGNASISAPEEQKPSENLKFVFNDNLKGYSVAVGKCTDTRIVIPRVYQGKAVVEVAEDGFRNCTGLISVTLPDTVKNIGEGAFNKCTSLSSITIPEQVVEIDRWAFYECSSLRTITIPKNVRNIGARAFAKCRSMECFQVDPLNNFYCSVDGHLYTKDMKALASYAIGRRDAQFTVPSGVVRIEDSAFSDCESLVSVTLPPSVAYIEDFAFLECVMLQQLTLPEHMTSIGENAFKRCKSLIRIRIPEGICTIKKSALRDCSALREVTLPSTLQCIEESAFDDCALLESIQLPSGIVNIEGWAFFGCSALKYLMIPQSVRNIGKRAFAKCSSLTRITVDPSNGCYCDVGGHLFTKDMKTLLAYAAGCQDAHYAVPNAVEKIEECAFEDSKALCDIVLPESVLHICEFAFYNCTALRSIQLPKRMMSLGNFVFKRCSSLLQVRIPEGIKVIGEETFRDCTALRSVTLPSSVQSIGEGAFNTCTALESINIPAKVTELKKWAFYECSALKSIAIPRSVKSIGARAFAKCTAMNHISVSFLNRSYRCVGNAVFTKDMEKLVAYAVGSKQDEYTIPKGVKYIEESAFSYSSLKSVTICSDLVSMGEFAFNQSTKLKTIRYAGTVEKWKGIGKESSSFRKALAKEVICIDGNVKL